MFHSVETLHTLPADVQIEVKGILKYYDKCFVTRSNGLFRVSGASSLDSSAKPVDFKVWGFKAKDVLSAEVRAEGLKELHLAAMGR